MLSDETKLVAITTDDTAWFADAMFDAWDRGAAVLPVERGLPKPALRRVFESLRPSRFIDQTGETALSNGVPVPGDTAVVLATSGTTGQPKGVQLGHAGLNLATLASQKRVGFSSGDTWLCCLPPGHIAGLMVLVRARLTGARCIIHNDFDPEAIRRESGVTMLTMVPTAFERLMQAGVGLSHCRAVLLGASMVPQDMRRVAQERGINIIDSYGMTEMSGGCVYDGVPLDTVQVRLDHQGQILLAGPFLMNGYRLQPELTANSMKDGFFLTGDHGAFSDEGKLKVLGRLDDVINTGGLKVDPIEVEAVLRDHPGVVDAAVIGLDDPQWGQVVGAVLVASPGAEPGLEEIRDFVAGKLGRYKAPRRVALTGAIPRTSTGKIRRPEAKKLFG